MAAMGDWPDSAAWLVRDALPARLLAAAAADSDAMAAVAPNFWVPRAAIEAAAGEPGPRTLAEQVVCALYERSLKAELPDDWAGAEWWCQVYKPCRGLPFHFDKDEELMKATGEMRHPAVSCVVYLNTAEECAGPVPLGATLVMQQRFDAEAGCGVPEPSRHDVIAWPAENCVLAFDGALAHGVLDSASTRVRRSMLVNWWREQPQGVQRASAEDYAEKHNLTPPLLPDALSSDDTKAQRERIAVCELRSAEDCAEGPVPLEEALARRGCGPADASAAAVHHPDTVIWQVETADEAGDAERDEAAFKPLVAALIPDEMAGADDDSESSSSGDSEPGDNA